jgi:hypothetical protein
VPPEKIPSPTDVEATLVRVHCADANPHGPGICEEDLAAVFSKTFTATRQMVTKGSYGIIDMVKPHESLLDQRYHLNSVFYRPQHQPTQPTQGFALQAYVYPTLTVRQRQLTSKDKRPCSRSAGAQAPCCECRASPGAPPAAAPALPPALLSVVSHLPPALLSVVSHLPPALLSVVSYLPLSV